MNDIGNHSDLNDDADPASLYAIPSRHSYMVQPTMTNLVAVECVPKDVMMVGCTHGGAA